MKQLGRNDPCHCGSGKKYKKCHLEADQRSHAATRPAQPQAEESFAASPVHKLPELLGQLAKRGPARDRKRFAQLLAETAPILEYMQRRGAIDAAAMELEAHRSEFEQLATDEARYLDLVRAVFGEECFVPLRYTSADVRRAFDQVGYPATMAPDDRTGEILRQAILLVADQERRHRYAASLLHQLPEFVARGRHREAWLLQTLAHETMENGQESNPFLYEMFSYGYDAWIAEKRGQNESLIRGLGYDVDQLRAMNPAELDSWIRSQTADPAREGMLAAFFKKNPHLRDESVANLRALEENSVKLLDREDSWFLRLPSEEILPWLKLFNERATQHGFPAATSDGVLSEEDLHRMFEAVVLPLMREIAESVFTQDRIRQLVADLRRYRSELLVADDRAAAALAMGAITYLEREDSPGLNTFLITLCWASIGSAVQAMGASTGETLPEVR
jgi:hypothetical protein